MTKHRRILLKLSGEALAGEQGTGHDPQVLKRIAEEIASVHEAGVALAIVCGGGNIFRGMQIAAQQGIDRVDADQMGMLATIQNGIALRSYLKQIEVESRHMTAISMRPIAEPFIRNRALRHLQKGRVIILTGGTGLPFFTTDTAAAHYGVQIQADLIVKATNVDGVYNKDPHKNTDAKHFCEVTYEQMLHQKIEVFDLTASTLLHQHRVPTCVYNMEKDSLLSAINRECRHTFVST